MDLSSANTTNLDTSIENCYHGNCDTKSNFTSTAVRATKNLVPQATEYKVYPVYTVKAKINTSIVTPVKTLTISKGEIGTFQTIGLISIATPSTYPMSTYLGTATFHGETINFQYVAEAKYSDIYYGLLKAKNEYEIVNGVSLQRNSINLSSNMSGDADYHPTMQKTSYSSSASGYKAPFEMNSSADGGVVTPQTVKAGLDLAKSIQQRRTLNPCKKPLIRESFLNRGKWAAYRECMDAEERKRQQEIDIANAKAQQKAYETQAVIASRGGNAYGSSDDRILGMPKNVAIGLGVVLIAGLGFVTFKIIKSRQTAATLVPVKK